MDGEGTGYAISNGPSLNDGQVLISGDGKSFDGEDKEFRVPEFIGVEVPEGESSSQQFKSCWTVTNKILALESKSYFICQLRKLPVSSRRVSLWSLFKPS
jgi:hypothetical protein